MSGRQTVSRILYPSLSARAAIIHLGLRSPESSSSLPGNYYGGPAMFPYLALLHVGFTKPTRYRIAGALLPHLFTLTGGREPPAVYFLWHFPSLTSPRATRHTALWSSDFPRGFPRDHPSACQSYDFMLLSNFCNSNGKGEWNSMGSPVAGWVNRKFEACRKYRSKGPY